MKKTIYAFVVLCICSSCVLAQNISRRSEKNKADKDRFAGLHFDFHAVMQDTAIGKTFTYGMIDSLLSIVKPDFIQVDCKGHPGVSSYPTKVGNAPAHFDKDIMKIWREVTNKHHIQLFIHYSGILDARAVQLHPEWARVNADGSYDPGAISLWGDYSHKLMEPQLVELAKDYKLDGAWIDGDCWALAPDYAAAATTAFKKETGIADIPKKQTAPGYFEWMEFNRKQFRNYITSYVNAAHQANPEFKITSNWSFSSMMPEKVDIPVDFLSGDVAGTNSLYSSAFESRCLALQGKPWDLMSWSFAWKNGFKSTKSVVQIKQEAAEVLAMGGGFQTYWQQNRDGSPELYQFGKMKALIEFTKARKEYCYEGSIIPQIGLLYSTYAWKRTPTSGLYSAHSLEATKGTLNMLLDSQLPVEILMDHQLSEKRMTNYPVLILPEWENIDPVQKEELLNYVKNGGNLIITGAKATEDFSSMLGIAKTGNLQKDTSFFAGIDNEVLLLKADFMPVQPITGTKRIGTQLIGDDWRFKGANPLATVRSFGKGKIAGVYLNMGEFYAHNKNPSLPGLLKNVLEEMGVDFLSTIKGSANIHQVVSQKNNKLYVHLINTSGPHDNPNVMVYGEVPSLSNITITVQSAKRPKAIKLQPENINVSYVYNKGHIIIKMPDLQVYNILEIEK